MRPSTRWPSRTIAILLTVAAGLFVIGVTYENDSDTHSDEPTAETSEHNEANESAEAIEAEGAERASAEAEESEGDERVRGIDVESPLLVVAAVVASLVLAGLVWRRADRRLLIVIAVFAAALAVLDVAEVAHQLDGDNTGFALLAGVVALLHSGAAVLAIQQTTRRTTANKPVTT